MRSAVKLKPEQVFETAKVVVFGRDGSKARGSWFPVECQEAAHAAAQAMGMNALDVANDDVRSLATKLPRGRIFDSGKAFVPFVQQSVVQDLALHLPEGEAVKVRASGAPSTATSSPSPLKSVVTVRHHPKGWGDIKVGSLVLACEVEKEGWFECVVQAIVDGQLRLRWLDYPEYEAFNRPPERVGLLWSPPTTSENA